MTVAGVIAEYNPLHNGHAWHLATTRQALAAEAVIVVMSGHFTQRGEPTIIDKWTRAAVAIECGADLVFELPTVYACSRAAWFAHGAVSLLDQLGLVTHLSFGSEAGDLTALAQAAQVLEQDPPELQIRAQKLTKLGLPHPRAQAEALSQLGTVDDSLNLLTTANNILALEYLRTLIRLDSQIVPWTVKRQGAGYHDLELGPLASATAIRQAVLEGAPSQAIAESLPEAGHGQMLRQIAQGRGPVCWSSLEISALALLRRSSRAQLADLPEVSEGLENRLWEMADAPSIDHWLSSVKTKRYTRSRLTRSLAHLLLGITKSDLEQISQPTPYARVLAMNATGRSLLSRCREISQIPIIQKPKSARHRLTTWGERLLEIDKLATDLWSLGLPNQEERRGAQDLTHEPLRLF